MEVFSQFSSDLDEATKKQLLYGQGLMQLLRQEQYHPWKSYEQVILLTAALNHLFQDMPVKDIMKVAKEMTKAIKDKLGDVCMEIEQSGQLSEENKERLLLASKKYIASVSGK